MSYSQWLTTHHILAGLRVVNRRACINSRRSSYRITECDISYIYFYGQAWLELIRHSFFRIFDCVLCHFINRNLVVVFISTNRVYISQLWQRRPIYVFIVMVIVTRMKSVLYIILIGSGLPTISCLGRRSICKERDEIRHNTSASFNKRNSFSVHQ